MELNITGSEWVNIGVNIGFFRIRSLLAVSIFRVYGLGEQYSLALGLRLGGFPATAEGLLSLRLSALSLPMADEGPA